MAHPLQRLNSKFVAQAREESLNLSTLESPQPPPKQNGSVSGSRQLTRQRAAGAVSYYFSSQEK